jgi:hypothetical protein
MIILSAFFLIAGIISVILFRKNSSASSEEIRRIPHDEDEQLILEDK